MEATWAYLHNVYYRRDSPLSKDLEYVRGSGRGVEDDGVSGKALLINRDRAWTWTLQWECAPNVSDLRSR